MLPTTQRFPQGVFVATMTRISVAKDESALAEYIGKFSPRYLALLLLVTLHAAWLLSYGTFLVNNEPRCQASCAGELDAIHAAYNATGGQGQLSDGVWEYGGGCLLVQPQRGTFGSCSVDHAATISVSGSQDFKVGLLPVGSSSACTLGCHDGSKQTGSPKRLVCVATSTGQVLKFTDGEDVQGRDKGVLCLADTMGFKDVDDDSYPQCFRRDCPTRAQQQFNAWIQIYMAFFFFFFAIQWLAFENEFAMVAFLFGASIVTLRALYIPLTLTEVDGGSPVNIIISMVLFFVYVWLAKVIHHSFGTFIFRITKTDISLRAVYVDFCKLQTTFQIDIGISLLNVICCHVYYFPEISWAAYIFLFLPLQLFKLLGMRAVRQELPMHCALCGFSLCVEPVFILVQLIQMHVAAGNKSGGEKHVPDKVIVWFIFGLSVFIRFFTLRLLWTSVNNFGKGLKVRLDERDVELRQGGPSRGLFSRGTDHHGEEATIAEKNGHDGDSEERPPELLQEGSDRSILTGAEALVPLQSGDAVEAGPAWSEARKQRLDQRQRWKRAVAITMAQVALEKPEEDSLGLDTLSIELAEQQQVADAEMDQATRQIVATPCHCYGNLVVNGRGHRKHFWSCCGRQLNSDPDPSSVLAEGQNECVQVPNGPNVEQLVGAWADLELAQKEAVKALKAAQLPPRPPSTDGIESKADNGGDHQPVPAAATNPLLAQIRQQGRRFHRHTLAGSSWDLLSKVEAAGLSVVASRLENAIEAMVNVSTQPACECTVEHREAWKQGSMHVCASSAKKIPTLRVPSI